MVDGSLFDRVVQSVAASPDRTVDEIARGVLARTYDVRRVLRDGVREGTFTGHRSAGNQPRLYRLALAAQDRAGRAGRVSQCALIAAVLRDGEWHSTAEIHQRCGFSRLNSRIAELRDVKRRFGMNIECRHIDGVPAGPGAQEYRFVGFKDGFDANGRVGRPEEAAVVGRTAAASSGVPAADPESDALSPGVAGMPARLPVGEVAA